MHFHDPPRRGAFLKSCVVKQVGMSLDIAILGAREFGKAMMNMRG